MDDIIARLGAAWIDGGQRFPREISRTRVRRVNGKNRPSRVLLRCEIDAYTTEDPPAFRDARAIAAPSR